MKCDLQNKTKTWYKHTHTQTHTKLFYSDIIWSEPDKRIKDQRNDEKENNEIFDEWFEFTPKQFAGYMFGYSNTIHIHSHTQKNIPMLVFFFQCKFCLSVHFLFLQIFSFLNKENCN